MPPLFGLGVLLDDSDYIPLFAELLSDGDKTAICSTPYTDRERSYVKLARRDEQLTIVDQGRYNVCWDRQQRAALIAAHSAIDIESASAADFVGILDDLASAVDWLLPAQQAAPDPCVIHCSQGKWKRSRNFHLKAFVSAKEYISATRAWCLSDVGDEEELQQINARDLRYHTRLQQYHNNHAPVCISQEERAASFFPVDVPDSSAAPDAGSSPHTPDAVDGVHNDAADAAGATTTTADTPRVIWLGSRQIPGIFAARDSDGLLNGFTALEVRQQVLRMKAYLTAQQLPGFCFFVVPLFHSSTALSLTAAAGSAPTATSPPDAQQQQQQQQVPPPDSAASVSAPRDQLPTNRATRQDLPAPHRQLLFLRGFKPDCPGIVEELLQAIQQLGVQGCTAEHVTLMSSRLCCRKEGGALLSLASAADVEKVQQLMGMELGGGKLYVAGGQLTPLPPPPRRRGRDGGHGGWQQAREPGQWQGPGWGRQGWQG